MEPIPEQFWSSVWYFLQWRYRINSSHELFNGVDHLLQNNGSDTLAVLTIGSNAVVIASYGDHGLYAVYDSISTVP